MSRVVQLIRALSIVVAVPLSLAAQGTPATITRPMSLLVNGQPLPVTSMEVRSTMQGTGTASDYFVAVEDLSSALGSVASTPRLQLRGNVLVALPITRRPSSGPASADSLDAYVDSLDNFRPGGVQPGVPLPITVRQGGTLSPNVAMINGKAYVPVFDLVAALGGTSTIGPGQIDISATGSCTTCILSPSRSP